MAVDELIAERGKTALAEICIDGSTVLGKIAEVTSKVYEPPLTFSQEVATSRKQ